MRKPTPNSERSKVRIFYVEGDFAPGDMQELTQAMANAIRPTLGDPAWHECSTLESAART
jgi:hypothetical protein